MKFFAKQNCLQFCLIFPMLFLGLLSCSKAKTDHSELARAPTLNINGIQGTWHIISRIPTYLDRDGENMTVEVKVNNRTSLDLKWNFEKIPPDLPGDATSKETTTWNFSGSIGEGPEVTRWRIYPLGPFYLNFQVVEYSGDYSWLILGSANRSYVWVLSKTPQIEPELFQGILKRLEDFKFDLSALKSNKELSKTAI